MKRLLILLPLILASCGDAGFGGGKLELGTYSVTEPEFGTVCVDILDKKNCDVYYPGESVFHGTYDIDGATLHIKGYAERPGSSCTFSLGVGNVQSPTSFDYQCSIRQASGYNGTPWLVFKKR